MATRAQKKRPSNKGSSLLTPQENEALFRDLDFDNFTLATGVVQLLTAEPPNVREWQKRLVGVVCFIKDYNEKGYFLRLYDIVKGCMTWEQAFYDGFMVRQKVAENAPELVTFEGDHFVYGLNFSSKDEATYFATQVNKRFEQEQSKKCESAQKHGVTNRTSLTTSPQLSTPVFNQSPLLTPGNFSISSESASSAKSKKRKTKFTKNDIGLPTNFEHRVHVGWTEEGGLKAEGQQHTEGMDVNLDALLEMMGMPKHLGKKDRQLAYEIVQKHGGVDALENEVKQRRITPQISAPSTTSIVPSTGGSLGTSVVQTSKPRDLPPLPPGAARTALGPSPPRPGPPPPPPEPPVARPPPLSNTPPAPPPPPPPASICRSAPSAVGGQGSAGSQVPPAPPIPPPTVSTTTPVAPASGDFLSQIAKGVALKSIQDSPQNRSPPSGSRDAMLKDIKEGVTLRPVDRQEKQRITPPEEMGGIAGALARALQERRFQISEETDSEAGEDEDEDEWED